MRVIGITGGVGCGKSTVLEAVAQKYNAYIIKADDVAKELMQPGQKAYEEVLAIFENITDAAGNIDREKLAQIIFQNPNKRIVLNSIVHPLVKKEIVNRITECRIKDAYDYVFVEAALLLEDHYDVFLDEIWYVYAPEEVRRQRLRESRGYSDEKIDQMIKSQLPEEAFAKACTVTIDNGRTMENTMSCLEKLLKM